jgi:hypothetical protein
MRTLDSDQPVIPGVPFYPLSDGPSIENHRITKSCFRVCLTCWSRSQSSLCLYVLRPELHLQAPNIQSNSECGIIPSHIDIMQTLSHFIPSSRVWHFDLFSSIVTIVVIPIILLILRIVSKSVRAWTRYAVDGVMYWLSRWMLHSLASGLSLKRYCSLQLETDSRFLYVPSRFDTKLEVDKAFVTLTLEHYGSAKRDFSHSDILSAGNRLRVVGDPGSGKSSLVKRLFRDACRSSIQSPRKGRLPVVLELKNLIIPANIKDKALGDWLLAHLREIVVKTEVFKMGECFDAYAAQSGLLVLLDGLDEVPRNRYPRVQLALQSLSTRLGGIGPRNIVVVTMRAQFHMEVREAFRDSYGPALYIRPFTPSDIYDFLTKWPFHAQSREMASRIFKDLTDRPTLRDLCANPLVLAMYVADYQASSSAFTPESRTEFYQRVSSELLIRRRLQQTGPTPAAGALREQRERILGRLAYDHMLDVRQPANSLRWSDAMRITREVTNCDAEEAVVLFRELAKETGLVSEERPQESLRFIHLAFCEFLASVEAVQGLRDGWQRLIQLHGEFQAATDPPTRARLLEVIPFACGLLTRVRRPDAIAQVAALRDFRLLGRCFLETKLYDDQTWPAFADTTHRRLIDTPESDWGEAWLRDLHLFNVVMRDAAQCSNYIKSPAPVLDLALFYRSLVERQRNSLRSILSSYAGQDAAAAFRVAEICGVDLAADFPEIVIFSCDQPPFLALAVQQVLADSGTADTWAPLIVEAALRLPVVAAELIELAPDLGGLARRARAAPRRSQWSSTRMLPASLYVQLVTVALMEPPNPACRLLSVLANVRAPSNLGLRRLALGRGALTFVGAVAFTPPVAGSALRILARTRSPELSPFAGSLWILSIIFLLVYYPLLRWVGWTGFYGSVLNLHQLQREGSINEIKRAAGTRATARLVVRHMMAGIVIQTRMERHVLEEFDRARSILPQP